MIFFNSYALVGVNELITSNKRSSSKCMHLIGQSVV